MKTRKIHVIANPAAGRRQPRRFQQAVALLQQSGADVSLFFSDCAGACTRLARVSAEVADIVVAAGGDGTINEVVNGLVDGKCMFGILPLGTVNVLARELGLGLNIEKAVAAIVNGRPCKVHLGCVYDRYFVLMAGVGFDAEIIYNLNLTWKRLLGRGAYALAALKLMRGRKYELRIRADDRELAGTFAVISNARFYAGPFPIAPRASLTEPCFDVCVFQQKSWLGLVRCMSGILLGRHLLIRDVQYLKARTIAVESAAPVRVQLDGDLAGMLPASFTIKENAITLLVPPERPQEEGT